MARHSNAEWQRLVNQKGLKGKWNGESGVGCGVCNLVGNLDETLIGKLDKDDLMRTLDRGV